MSIRVSIERILAEYKQASRQTFTGHPLASFIRRDFVQTIQKHTNYNGRLRVRASAGQSRWVRGPWAGIFDEFVTTGAQEGFYPVYLFREDMSGVYLSLNQAMTEAKTLHGANARRGLLARARDYRETLNRAKYKRFNLEKIDLRPSEKGNDTTYYEAGNIFAVFYGANKLPTEEVFIADLLAMIEAYEELIRLSAIDLRDGQIEGDEPIGEHVEDATRIRIHRRIERNSTLAKRVKQLLGHTCQVCNTNFEQKYGAIGRDYIEAHHLRPLASLRGKKVALDPRNDFAVLCSNCHRMVHRSGYVDDIERFKREHFVG